MKSVGSSLLIGLAVIAAVMVSHTGGTHMATKTHLVKTDLPPLDRQTPARFETATFSLG
ncbi:MAG: hypothetical protein M0024_01650 [Nitrospiraceae bacterium]|nr:hypothetical protein [Nitrospiraceae bacterium]